MLLVLLIYKIRFYVSFYSFDRSLSLTYPISFIHAFIHSTEQNIHTHTDTLTKSAINWTRLDKRMKKINQSAVATENDHT